MEIALQLGNAAQKTCENSKTSTKWIENSELYENWQCCHIWQFITNLAAFDFNLLSKFPFGYLAFLATFLATFEKLAKNWF